MTDKLMRIQGMTCAHCEKTVAEALTTAGARRVVADWRRGQAVLDTSSASNHQLSAAVEAAGYRVASIEDARREERGFTPVVGDRSHDYDLVVLGSGSAAFAAAITATEAGARVALMESNVVGGTCVNVGCVPSKAMLAPAEAYFRAGHHPFVGIGTSTNGFDLGALVDSKTELVERLRAEKYVDLAADYGFEIRPGRAEFADAETVLCGADRMTAGSYLVATGASPAVPPIPGLREAGYLTSTSALELREPPRRLIVLGAGPVGLELGQLFLHLGSEVTFITRGRVAPREEPETSEALRSVLEEEGSRVFTSAQVRAVRRDGERRSVAFTVDGEEHSIAADHVLVATGRQPNTADLGLDRAGVDVTERGAVRVDDGLSTSNPRVWAAGDVTGHPQYVYL